MRCVIFCAAPYGELPFSVESTDFVIACDGGWNYAKKWGILPQRVVGDFDSIQGEIPQGAFVLRYPKEKDDSDGMLAIQEGLRQGCDEFVLLYSLGGRLDHTIANCQLMTWLAKQGKPTTLMGPADCITLTNDHLSVPKREGFSLSVFAWGGEAVGVTLQGVQYQTDRIRMRDEVPLGLSNQIMEESADISVEEGWLLVVQSRIE